jgi:phosphoglycolate phosphatase
MGKTYQVVIFDWDGTLMDSTARIVSCLRTASQCAELTILSNGQYANVIGLSLDHALRALHPEATEWQIKVMDAVYRWQFMEANTVEMSPFSGAESLLQALTGLGKHVAVATGKSRHGLDAVLADTGFGQYFTLTKSAEETASKPDPKMLHEILNELSLDVSQAVMVGDSVFDLDMAQRLGMDCVAVTHGVHGIERLQAFNPVCVCDDLHQLHAWLTQ